MKSIAVLGARGFIGKNTVEYLRRNEEYRVLPVCRDRVDLLNEKAVEKFFEEEAVDCVIHCGNQGGTRKIGYGSCDVIGNNLKMFFNIERCCGQKTRLINFGSGAQYNKSRDLKKINEKDFDKSIPKDDYGYSKYVMSKYIRKRANTENKINIYNPIIFGMYGIGEDYTYRFISNAIIKNILRMPIVINQNAIFDYLYVEDYYKVLDKLINEDLIEYEFNVTPTESISLIEAAEYINEIGPFKSQIKIINEGMNYQYSGDNSRLLKIMGKEFQFTPYKDAIQTMYNYYENHMDNINLEEIRNDSLIKYCITRKKL